MIIRRQAFYQVRKLFKIDRLTSKVIATFSFLIFMNQIYWVYSVHLTSLSWKAVLVYLVIFVAKRIQWGKKSGVKCMGEGFSFVVNNVCGYAPCTLNVSFKYNV